jgi:hypothetical protein
MSTFTTEDLKGLKKDELLALCEEEGLEVDESLKVSEIKDVLLEVSEEEAEESTDSEEVESEETEEEEDEESPEAPEGKKAYKCAQGNVKFEGKLYKRGEYITTQENPEFESLVEQGILTC